jgi:hypothetical protein
MNIKKDHWHKDRENRDPKKSATRDMSEVNFRAILGFGVALVIVGVAIFLLMPVFFRHLSEREARLETPRSPLLSHDQLRLPPEPRLQLAPGHALHPLEEMKQLRASEDAVLNSYGWVDQKAGTVRIPIELAKQLILQKGLPADLQGKGDPGIPLASSSGRTWQRRQ